MKYSLAFFVAIWLTGCSIFGAPTEIDETKGWQADRIYQEADAKMRDRDYDKALKYYKILESRYPHGKYAAQAQLETAYAYYKKSDPVSCVAAADRFIKLHPNHPNVDYAYYMRGLASFTERGMIEKLTSQEINDRDPKQLNSSFLAFKELISRFPESRYAKDSALRMTYLVNALAAHELHVARYYMKRGAYLAAANRCKYVLENYPHATGMEEALVILISAYDSLEFNDLKEDTMRVLKTNYPDSKMLLKGVPKDQGDWWKFWESLYQ
ncbi:MAG: outer membrane protein assembly factor BamD [Methylophilaceae bacterium]|jgi:outer membrane protein assembly factor BamD|nr:outer membrane protein assembly factor BamD [Methylophilaceae bacterium]NBQ85058.1 outer membrane protein assembly factor BamD [Methylophilaceae bacterium]